MPRAWRRLTLLLFVVVLAARAHVARADEVDDLIKLVQRKPAGMDEEQWKEERRDAATKLGKLGDRRAVPALIEVVQTETFDVVAENAIDALGKLGDKRAVPVLEQVAADDSRDRESRDKARRALRKLGAKQEPKKTTGDDDDDLGLGIVGNGGTTTTTVGAADRPGKIPDGPKFSDDTLAATERFTIASGAAHLNYDTQRNIASLDADITGTYRRELERKTLAYGYGADVHVAAGALDLPGPGTASEALIMNATGSGDSRFYWQPGGLYGAVEGNAGLSVNGVKVERQGPNNTTKELLLGVDLTAAVGAGYGRQIDLGEALRLRRIEMALEDARALGRPITPDLAARILRTWWALRGEVGAHDRLVATIAILREAGVLLGEPDASLTYRILQILVDGQLDHRPSGFDARLLISEGYRLRDNLTGVPDGRVETVLLRARYGLQAASTTQELVGEAWARKRILAGMDPAPWAAAAAAAWRHYVYGAYDDPIGAFELRAELGASNDDTGLGTSARLGGAVGWLWAPSRASQLRLQATATLEGGELVLGASFEGSYGFLDVGFVGQGAYGAVK